MEKREATVTEERLPKRRREEACDSGRPAGEEERQESVIPLLLMKINQQLRASADRNLEEWGLTLSQARVLHVIGEHGGSVAQRELERILEVSHPTVVGLVSRMQKNGFVNISIDTKDHRNKIVSFAEKAYRHKVSLRWQHLDVDDCLLRGMTEEEIRQAEILLRRMYRNVQDWDEGRA